MEQTVSNELTRDTSSIDRIIDLNVGGVHYTTSLSTLSRFPDSFLEVMFSGRFSPARDAKGRYEKSLKKIQLLTNVDTLSIEMANVSQLFLIFFVIQITL